MYKIIKYRLISHILYYSIFRVNSNNKCFEIKCIDRYGRDNDAMLSPYCLKDIISECKGEVLVSFDDLNEATNYLENLKIILAL